MLSYIMLYCMDISWLVFVLSYVILCYLVVTYLILDDLILSQVTFCWTLFFLFGRAHVESAVADLSVSQRTPSSPETGLGRWPTGEEPRPWPYAEVPFKSGLVTQVTVSLIFGKSTLFRAKLFTWRQESSSMKWFPSSDHNRDSWVRSQV